MKPENEAVTNQSTAKLPLSKADFMAKWNKLSPRAQRELLDLAKEKGTKRVWMRRRLKPPSRQSKEPVCMPSTVLTLSPEVDHEYTRA